MLRPARSEDCAGLSAKRQVILRAHPAIGDDRLRSVPALRFPDVPAVVRRHEFGTDALPAGAGVEDDLMAIDQIFASSVDFWSHRSTRRAAAAA